MGFLGLSPQNVNQFGDFGVRSRESDETQKILEATLTVYYRKAKLLDIIVLVN